MKSLLLAFSTYSAIPMPRFKSTDRDMGFCICYFPLIGVVIGLADLISAMILMRLHVGNAVYAAVFTLMPLVITGGIHMDGFIDTCDALHSWKSREEKLKILKDVHVGAFAVIRACMMMLLQFVCMTELRVKMLPVLGVSYILSRALSGLAAVSFPKAKKDGMLNSVTGEAPAAVKNIMMLEAAAAVILMLVIDPVLGIACSAAAAGVFAYYYRTSKREFGGVTGDLAGWFLVKAELAMPAAMILLAAVLRAIR